MRGEVCSEVRSTKVILLRVFRDVSVRNFGIESLCLGLGAHDARDCAPPFDHRTGRPDPGDGCRKNCRARQPR